MEKLRNDVFVGIQWVVVFVFSSCFGRSKVR